MRQENRETPETQERHREMYHEMHYGSQGIQGKLHGNLGVREIHHEMHHVNLETTHPGDQEVKHHATHQENLAERQSTERHLESQESRET